jgi:hypothetical protein
VIKLAKEDMKPAIIKKNPCIVQIAEDGIAC